MTVVSPADGASAQAAACPWVGSSAPVATRVSEVMAQMTLAEKISMVHGTSGPYVGNVPAIPSLCIPALNLEDGPAGVADGMTGVTQLPAPVAAAATWDSSDAQQYGDVIGAEEAGKGANVNLGPTINIVRDPRWGRAFESLGEDPYLTGQLAASEIQGVQSQGVLSQVKHLAVYNQETNRNTPADNAIVSDRAMQEIYLPAFQTSVQQGGAASVMCSYSTINGTYACENPYILTQVLRDQFGFQGFVTSDWGATHSTVPSAQAGLDMQMPDNSFYGDPLRPRSNRARCRCPR
jgi:beta-glucosidase